MTQRDNKVPCVRIGGGYGVRIERIFAMANKWTFLIKPIKNLIIEEMEQTKPWVDPFAGMHSPAHIRNDINPEAQAEYHLDALEFIKQFDNESVAGVLFDPPYSTNQIRTTYNNHGMHTNTCDRSYQRKIKVEINRILQINGGVITCGWNSNGCSIQRTKRNIFPILEKTRFLIVAHGTTKNDTIVTVERKIQRSLQ